MNFGVVLWPDPPVTRVVELTRNAEAAGFDCVWTFDSHMLWQEPFVHYALMLDATERVKVGPMVTNPGTRDWTVIASLFATLNDAYGDRTVCGMGRGDSALRVIGRKPRTLETMRESMEVIKGLVAGREVDYQGTRVTLSWLDEERGWDLPMWVAGYGPKALDLIGRHADGFILQLADPQILVWTRDVVRAAARDAGRDPDEIKLCVAAPAYVGDNLGHQRDQLRWFGGMVGNHVVDIVNRYGADGSSVPRGLTDYIEAREVYDYSHHGRAGNPTTDWVPDEAVDRFCVVGTAADHIRRLEELRDLGVDHFALYLMHDQIDETLAAYGERVIPALS
jgi:probable F420-dependent oxidoreductase